jgi:hypothetical protein
MVNRKTRRLNRKVSRRSRKVRKSRKVRRSRKQRGGNVKLLTLGAAVVGIAVADAVVNSQYYTDFQARRVLKNYKHGLHNIEYDTW